MQLQALLSYGDFAKRERDDMKLTYGSSTASDLKVCWTALERNPDALLDHEGWRKFAKLQTNVERAVYSLRVPCTNIPCDRLPCPQPQLGCVHRRAYLTRLMRDSRDPAALRASWLSAQLPLETIGQEQWGTTLKLAGKIYFTNRNSISNHLIMYKAKSCFAFKLVLIISMN